MNAYKRDNKGFTLAELLIVVAIIAVLVAIAIPVFTKHLEKSREATDLANVRAAYAEISAAVLTNDDNARYNNVPIKQSDDSFRLTVTPLQQKKDGWTMNVADKSIGSIPSNKWVGAPKAGGAATIEYIPSLDKWTLSWGNVYGANYSSMASSEFANKNTELTAETADQRLEADKDAMRAIAARFLGMTSDEIMSATGNPSYYSGRLTNPNEGVGVVSYRNQQGKNPQVRGDVTTLRDLGYSGDIGSVASNSYSDSQNRTFFSDYMNSGSEAQVKIGKVKYDSNGKAVSITVWMQKIKGDDAPEELQNIVVTE